MRTTVGLVFLFQVSDHAALERWVRWFKGGKAENSTDVTKREEKELSVALNQLPTKAPSATFGVKNTTAISSVAQPSLAAHSSFYAPSALGSQQMHDTESALHNRSTSTSFKDQNIDSTTDTGSFGVNSIWPRYP